MKKISIRLFSLLAMIVLFAVSCGSKVEEKAKEAVDDAVQKVEEVKDKITNGKALIVYYSETGTTENVVKALEGVVNGTQIVKADVVKIETVEPYNPETIRDVVKKQMEDKAYPEIKPVEIDLDVYDYILVGTPTWGGYPAAPLISYLESQDFSGKKVTVFATYNSNPAEVLKETEAYIKGATFIPGLAVKGEDIKAEKHIDTLKKWTLENVLGIK